MQQTLLPLFLLSILTSCASPQTKEISWNPIVLRAKQSSLYAENVNWKEVNARFVELTSGKNTPAELKPGLQYLLNALGDKHASFRSAKDYSVLVSYTGATADGAEDLRDPDFVNTVINDVTAEFSHQLLEGGIGYLKVVGIGPGDVKAQADRIRSGLNQLKGAGVNRWILDLRCNGGGNLEPMLAGLAPLLGEGDFGGATDAGDTLSRRYRIEKDEFNNNGRIVCPMDESLGFTANEKVAVLLSRYTISSGEAVGIAFKGRANTRFFGEPSAGYTTGNGFDYVSDELIMLISQDVFTDRNGTVYHQRVPVDEYRAFAYFPIPEVDPQVTEAALWLASD